ncbi:YfgM family protein [Psychrobacter lutiphocae]|uniref:YfgM family protein n=1 Tax=Psychrobacter lutiphocae TaxID=540500 RepID=UPI000380D90A|nr:tetratricopeptide repeat protein [Psychrobacter lutiphocae]
MAKHPNPATPEQHDPSKDAQSMEKLKQSAGYIIGAILIALIGYFGWNYLQNSGMKADTVAADKYAAIETANDNLRADPDAEGMKQLSADIDALVAEHGKTIYAWQALMLKARNAVDVNDNETALAALQTALEIDLHDAGLHAISQLRYATVLLASGQVDEALTQASIDVPVAFEGTQQELLGDIYLAQKEKEKAIRAYKNAWSLLSKRNEQRPFLYLKLENLGVTPEPIEPEAQVVSQEAMLANQEAMLASLEAEQEAAASAEADVTASESNE